MSDVRPLWVADQPEEDAQAADVNHPYDGTSSAGSPFPPPTGSRGR